MKLYYTTTAGYDAAQLIPTNSLGGYKSSTPIPNDSFGNLFDDLSLYGMKQAKTQYRALVLVNELPETANDVEFWFDSSRTKTLYCDFLIGAVIMNTDADGNPIMENIPTIYSKPFYTQLYPANVESKVSIGSLEPGKSIGLWFARILDSEVIKADYNDVAEKIPNAVYFSSRYKPKEKETEELIDLQISWT
jgi:hypothetical protein